MSSQKRLHVPSQELILPSRRKFMKNIAAISAGAFVGGFAGPFVASSMRQAQASGGAGSPQAWCNTLNPGVQWCYNYDTHYNYQTRYGCLHTEPNGGEAPWNATTINGEGYHYSIAAAKYDATHRIYWDNFGFDLGVAGSTRMKALHIRLIAESFTGGSPSGTRTQPKSGNQIDWSKDVTNVTSPLYTGWIDYVNNHGWQGTVQPFIKGGRNWNVNLWVKSCTFNHLDPDCDQYECCGAVTAACPGGGGCPCDNPNYCNCDSPSGLGYLEVHYWYGPNPAILTAAEVEDAKFGLSIQVAAKSANQYFHIRTNPAPEIRVYW